MEVKAISIHPLVLAAISFYVALTHLGIYFRSGRKRVHLSFSITTLMAMVYQLLAARSYAADHHLEAAHFQLYQMLLLAPFGATLLFFTWDYLKLKRRKRFYTLLSVFTLHFLTVLFFPKLVIDVEAGPDCTKTIQLGFLPEITYHESTLEPLGSVLVGFFSILIASIFLVSTLRYLRARDQRARWMAISTGIFSLFTFNDALVVENLIPSIYLAEVGFVAFVFSMAAALSEEIRETANLKKQKAELEAQLALARRSNALGLLASAFAHRAKNLIAPFTIYTDLLAPTLESDDSRLKTLDRVGVATQETRVLCQQLLVYGKRYPLKKTPITLEALLEESESLIRRYLPERIRISRLSVKQKNTSLNLDLSAFQQLLQQIASNVKDALPDGGTLEISGRVSNEGKANICFKDSGVGMDEQLVHRAFDPFFSTKAKRSGLGLSLVYGVIAQHGGTAQLESSPGLGSTLCLTLPAKQVPSTDQARSTLAASHEAK